MKVLFLNLNIHNLEASEATLTQMANEGYKVMAMSAVVNYLELFAFTLQKD